VDNRNRHLYVNDKLDFSISYFDVIGKKQRQPDSIDFKKTEIPPQLQTHLNQTIKRPSELLFTAHRTSMSSEDIVAVLYKNKENIADFSKKMAENIRAINGVDSLNLKLYQTYTGFFIDNHKIYEGSKFSVPHFFEKRPFSSLIYRVHTNKSDYKVHEFHVAWNEKLTLRLMWIADIHKTDASTIAEWEKIDEQNHYLELFSLNDSAKFRLREVIPDNIYKVAQDAFKEYGYLGAVKALEEYEAVIEKKGTDVQKNIFYQAAMTFHSFLGDNKKALFYQNKAFLRYSDSVDSSFFNNYKAVDAADFVLQKGGNQQVIMFNEAHNCGQNRAFLRDNLKRFYDKGFRYLALEGLDSNDSINERGYPMRMKSGFYTNEPVFGQMLREALNIGFQLVGYENEYPCPETDCRNFRETKQTENLKKILDKDPNAKIIVWAGHDHIFENYNPVWEKMASRFKKLTNIDPLTIEQTQLREGASENNEQGIWKTAIKKWDFKKPVVVVNKDSIYKTGSAESAVDMQVFYPRTDYPNDYPHWMGNSETTFYDLSLEKDYFKDKLLEIFIAKEYAKEIDGAVPVMNIPLSRIGNFRLFLKPEKYVAVVRDQANWEYFYKEFEIKQ
jgi:hypothetical protein